MSARVTRPAELDGALGINADPPDAGAQLDTMRPALPA